MYIYIFFRPIVHKKRDLSVAEISDLLEEVLHNSDDEDNNPRLATIVMDPPGERPEADTDDPDDPQGFRLPRRLLQTRGEKVQKGLKRPRLFGNEESKDDNEDEEEDSDESRSRPASGSWTSKNSGCVGSNVPVFEPPAEDAALAQLKKLKTAYEFYKVFQPDDFLESVLHQSNLYSEQKGRKLDKYIKFLSYDTLRCTEAVLLLR